MFVLINELKLKKKEQKNRENMKNILILIQLTNLVIPQDVPQVEVESNDHFNPYLGNFGNVTFPSYNTRLFHQSGVKIRGSNIFIRRLYYTIYLK